MLFNKVYIKFFKLLEYVCNGYLEIMEDVIGFMYEVEFYLKVLLCVFVDDNGDFDIEFNIGLIFEFILWSIDCY